MIPAKTREELAQEMRHDKVQRDIGKVKGISEYAREELKRMHRELTDDDVIADNKRIADRKQRLQEKVTDTGLYE